MLQSDPVWNWIFNFRKTESLPKEEREEKHRADAGGQQRARGAHNAKSPCLKSYGFFTSVAV